MRISIILILLVLGSCSKPELINQKLLILGHGGEGFDDQNTLFAPNSVGSIHRALDFYRLDGVELDLQFTKDRELVVFHDDFLENSTQCKGRINSVNLNEIVDCNYRKQFYNDYNEQVISLDSLIHLINIIYPNQLFSLNVKIAPDDLVVVDSLAPKLARKLEAVNNPSTIAVECADANFLYFLRKFDERLTCYLVANIDTSNVKDVERFGLQGIVSRFDERSERLEKQLNENAKKIFLYGQKTSRHYSQYSYKYINGVQVDNPILAKKMLTP